MRYRYLRITILTLLLLLYPLLRPELQGLQPVLDPPVRSDPPFLDTGGAWADSLMEGMSLEERIAQMIMVYGYSNMGPAHEKAVLKQVNRQKVGGILFFQGEPLKQARLTNLYQMAADIPLLVAMDGESGLGMRLRETMTYPAAMILGGIADNSLIYRLGRDMGTQFNRLGVHMNLAPVADINNNPANPVIGSRSFGEGRQNVTAKVVALMEGLQDKGVLVAAKHFPGHGDTDTDSHQALPLIPYDRERLDSLELFPFREAIYRGLTGVMVAHLRVPELDDRENRATTLSRPAITGLLKEEMGFRGLIITDALNMKGLSSYFEPGIREVEAVRAGNDILLMPADVDKAISAIKRAVRQGSISEEEINGSCRKILQAKYWTGAHRREIIRIDSLLDDLNSPAYQPLFRKLVEHSLILAKNADGVLPVEELERTLLATVTISKEGKAEPLRTTDKFLEGDHFTLSSSAILSEQSELIQKLDKYNTVIVNVLNTSSRASRNYGITDQTLLFLEQLDPSVKLIVNVSGVPYALGRFSGLEHLDALVLSHKDDSLYQDLALQAIFGGASFSGRMPVSAGSYLAAGEGADTGPASRLGYASPLDVGLHPDTLLKMEEIIHRALREKAMPGCQVLVARRGKVVWHRTYGHHTYQRKRAVQADDIYDLASITKMASITAALMRLHDLGKFHEDSLLGAYEPIPDSSNKAGLLVADVLAHQSGMIPYIPFYYETLEPLDTSQTLLRASFSRTHPLKIGEGAYFNRHVKYVDSVYQDHYSPEYPYQAAEKFYMRADLRDTIYKRVYDSELLSREYRYSGLGFLMFQQIIEAATDTMLYPYVWHNFYNPMGAQTLGYKPLSRFPRERIVPTENDNFYRKQLLQGHVHDQAAAMLGGVSGNAGLFGSANDLAKLMQMFMNGGLYGQRRYIRESTLKLYTSCYNCEEKNHRGFGFNKPVFWEEDAGPACNSASPLSFGHSGFTGTLAWADPAYELVYIFLSNRVHPDMGNNLLIDMNVRTDVQQVIYNALMD
ncbi:MAG: glycoside hydrolase family 3 N-terminal domain-containing protein [Bacteroidales bacterium]|nr:glycoside hydrolase family 3 N-terminal domain-containing protein [Bacteroidales bacterium]